MCPECGLYRLRSEWHVKRGKGLRCNHCAARRRSQRFKKLGG